VKNDSRYIVGGAALGAVLGALVGWALGRTRKRLPDGSLAVRSEVKIESRQLMRLGGLLVALIRQIIDLG
jgi:membrane protein YqaA with SNARE-associated domain